MESLYMGMRLFGRACVTCNDTNPSCPTCDDNEQCQLTLQTCSSCAATYCVSLDSSSSSASASASAAATSAAAAGHFSHSTNTGAIAGGVVGGLAFVAIVLVALFLFYRRKRSRATVARLSNSFGGDDEKPDRVSSVLSSPRNDVYNIADDAQSTHTVHSVADSTITRASNIIPIAYIPGVINRSNPSSPSYVPPIPEMPIEHAGASSGAPSMQQQQSDYSAFAQQQQQPYTDAQDPVYMNPAAPYYTSSENRGMSVYSGATYDSQEDQSIRESIGIRDSLATSNFRSTVFNPATMTAIRAKPNLIERKQS
ncbi:hypothetical protein BZA70DRAFT_273845 [Myxozyma melibiosi]|uniref:Membrane anchor Opy2 N-terminal domain-containing protein n=1 Tax=Myxozyma melibiosi TaxID=54550 RepID=A0ABR1FFF3_9ASCO